MEGLCCQTIWKEPDLFQGNYAGHNQPQNEKRKSNEECPFSSFSCWVYKQVTSFKEFIVERSTLKISTTYVSHKGHNATPSSLFFLIMYVKIFSCSETQQTSAKTFLFSSPMSYHKKYCFV